MLHQAQLALGNGREADARGLLQAAIAREPLEAELWHATAKLLLQFERPDEAAVTAATAVLLEPDSLEKRLTLAQSLQRRGDIARALAEYEAAAALDPVDTRVQQGLAAAYQASGPRSGADPNAAALVGQLFGEAQRLASGGQPEQAIERLLRCAQLLPGTALIHYRIGCLLQDMGQGEAALSHYELATRLQPDLFAAVHNAGKLAAGFGLAARARRLLTAAHQLRPQSGISFRLELLTDAIHPSREALLAARARYEAGVERLLEAPPRIDDPLNKVELPTFYLAYHGLCNRQLHTKLARAYLCATPELSWTAPHCLGARRTSGRIRVGFISQFLRSQHSIGKVARGLIAELSREHFEVYVLNLPPVAPDDTNQSIRAHCDHWLSVKGTLAEARAQIGALLLDVLFYQDIGMEPFSYLLAQARLAPVQCVSYGHPDTTGIPNMDYYISNDLYEPPGAAAHYSERLVELRGLPTLAYYFRPQVPQPLPTREQLGLPDRVRLYLCPQSLFKLHPEFDDLLRGILERDGGGHVLLFAGECSEWSLSLRQRFRAVMPGVADRIRFLPRQPYARFLQLLAAADVVLDTIHFNGMNTSIDAFAVGTPVVTLPTALQRGRFTQAMYRTMDIAEGVAASAEQYCDLAVSIARDPERRRTLSRCILERSESLFQDRRAVTEFEQFFLAAHHESVGRGG